MIYYSLNFTQNIVHEFIFHLFLPKKKNNNNREREREFIFHLWTISPWAESLCVYGETCSYMLDFPSELYISLPLLAISFQIDRLQ